MADTCNISRHLPLMAERQAKRAAIKIPQGRTPSGEIRYLSLSFEELNTEAATWQARMEAAGVVRGMRCLVMVRPGLPLISAVFALFAIGAVPVVIDPGMGLKSFLSCVRRSRPAALVGIPLARLISHVARGAFKDLRIRVAAPSALDARLSEPGAPRLSLRPAATREDELAAILFTSGSTGAPKGVCYEHGMFEAQVRLVRDTYGIEPGEVDMPLLPIFALFNPALGMTSIIPEVDPRRPAQADAAALVQALRQEGVTNSFGSPTLWRKIGDHCLATGTTLPSLRRVLCAGAPVPASLWADSSKFLPNGRLHSPYGATESLPVSSVAADTVKADSLLGAHVGRVVGGMEMRVIEMQEGPVANIAQTRRLATGQIGEIIVKGPVVTREYDQLPEATAAAKIAGADGSVWHRMGDTGFLDANGELWFCGRKVERVVTEDGETLYTEPCERVFRRHPRAARCALVGTGPKGRQTPAIVVEARIHNSAEARTLARELRLLALATPHTERIRVFYFHPKFPVDVRHNAKIHRLTLAKWAETAVGFASDPKK